MGVLLGLSVLESQDGKDGKREERREVYIQETGMDSAGWDAHLGLFSPFCVQNGGEYENAGPG